MRCPNCRHENRPAAKFCSECRAKLARVCPECGIEVVPAAKFCDECGADLPSVTTPAAKASSTNLEEQFKTHQHSLPSSLRNNLLADFEGENRLSTILFADMSGSVRTTRQLHPEDAATLVNRLLQSMVDLLMKHGGRINGFRGDGVLAVFGAPQAHENDPERAIQAALEIRQEAQALGFQVTAGINTGEVYVGEMGSAGHKEISLMGPVVDLAARLQGKAEPGEVIVGEATYRHTRRAFEFFPVEVEIKGVATPVTAYRVERAWARPEKVRGIEGLKSELIGREEDLSKLTEALEELRRGRGQVASLIGEAGTGKSRLVSELKQIALGPSEGAAPLWLEGRCLEMGMTASYWLFVDLFRDYFAWRPDEDDRSRGERLVSSLRDLVERGDLSRERLEEIGPLLGNLLSIQFGNTWDDRLKNASPEQIKHQTFLAVRDFFLVVSRPRPIVLVLEDLHWADSLSLDLIHLLMEALTLAPLFLLCVYRPEQDHKSWRLGTVAAQKYPERFTELQLRELTPQQSRRLVESLLTIDSLPGSVKDLILEKSHGNPFFVEEVVRSLVESGRVYREGETWKAKEGIVALAVPETVQSVILSRVDRLDTDLKRVLQSAAVIGRIFRRRLLEYAAKEGTELERALWELEDRRLIYQERVIPEEEYSFKHVLTQETVYGNILKRRRAEFHHQVAEAMEALYAEGLEEYYEQLAFHYERSGDDGKAVHYLLRAGEKARRAYDCEAAAHFFGRALERVPALPSGEGTDRLRLEALKGLSHMTYIIGDCPRAALYFREAIALGERMGAPPKELARLCGWLGQVLIWIGPYDELETVSRKGLALVKDDPCCPETVLTAYNLIYLGSRGEEAEELYRLILQALKSLPYSEEVGGGYLCIADYFLGRKEFEKAFEWFDTFFQRAEKAGDLTRMADGYLYMGHRLLLIGDTQRAVDYYRRGADLSTKIGDQKYNDFHNAGLFTSYLAVDELEKAEEYAGKVCQYLKTIGNPHFVWDYYRVNAIVSLCHGDRGRAGEFLEKALAIGEQVGTPSSIGRLSLHLGQREQAIEYLKKMPVRQLDAFDVSVLEDAFSDPVEFRAYCRHLKEQQPTSGDDTLQGWYLSPSVPWIFEEIPIVDEAFESLSGDWRWVDPNEDCSYNLKAGLEIQASNVRDLARINLSAPRLLRSIDGDFAVQTASLSPSNDRPAIGGLLLWKDPKNYLRLDRGTRGQYEVSFQGCLNNGDIEIGRGRLPSDRIILRLERRGSRVNALCSADGEEWFTAGSVEFPVDDPVEIGLHAIGNIDRLVYPGAYTEGTTIQFESFDLWR